MSRAKPPIASKLLAEAAAALTTADFEEAKLKVTAAFDSEPRIDVRRGARKAPQTIHELMPLLRRKTEAGIVLLQLRKSLGMTQPELARVCEVPRNYIGQVELGRQSMSEAAITKLLHWMAERGAKTIEGPAPDTLLKLRTLLGFTPFAMASKLGLKEIAVRRMETGGMPIAAPIADAYRQLAREHGYDLDQLATAA